MNDTRRMRRCVLSVTTLVSLFCLATEEAVQAQVSPTFNRKVTGISLTENPTGGYDVTAEWRIDLEGTQATDVQVGTSVEFRLNSTTQSTADAEECLIWELDAGGADCATDPDGTTCGSATFGDITPVVLTCDSGACSTPTLTSTFTGVSLVVEDEIMVLLRPAPGAAPDGSTNDDDEGILTFGSWNRRLVALHVVQSDSGGGGLFDVIAEVVVDLSAGSTVPLDIGLDTEPVQDPCCLEACCCPSCSTECGGDGCGGGGGNVETTWKVEEGEASLVPCTGEPCVGFCGTGTLQGEAFALSCEATNCLCQSGLLSIVWSGLSLTPGELVYLALRPAAGALPELPTAGGGNDDAMTAVVPDPIPTVSEWGVIVLALSILALATLVIRVRSTCRV